MANGETLPFTGRKMQFSHCRPNGRYVGLLSGDPGVAAVPLDVEELGGMAEYRS